MKKYKDLIIYAAIIIFVILFRIFIATPVIVDGISMDPTLKNGDILILNELNRSYHYGDIVVINLKNEQIIKRVIGVPGDKVEYKGGILYLNGNIKEDNYSKATKDFSLSSLGYDSIPDNYYLVLGDNRSVSYDSRYIGLISKNDIMGTVFNRIYPIDKFGSIK